MSIKLEEIKYKREITEPSRDGGKFIFDVGGRNVEVNISRTAMGADGFGNKDIIDRLTHFIKLSVDSHSQGIFIIKINIVANNGNGWKVETSGRKNVEFIVNDI